MKKQRGFFIEFFAILTVIAIVAVLVLAVQQAARESARWEKFKADHACRIVGHMDGSTFNTFGLDARGNTSIGIGSTPGKTAWLCDDGITYWK